MEEYQVEKILKCRTNTDQTKSYFVKWKRFPNSQNTWEPEENLITCQSLVKDFNRRNKITDRSPTPSTANTIAKNIKAKEPVRDRQPVRGREMTRGRQQVRERETTRAREPAWRREPKKTVKDSLKFKKKVEAETEPEREEISDNTEEEKQEDEVEQPQKKMKRSGAPLKEPVYARRSMKAIRTPPSKVQPVYNQSQTQKEEEEVKEDDVMEKDDEETNMNMMCAAVGLKVQVLSMSFQNNEPRFKVRKEGNEIDIVSRSELLKLDRLGLIVFYESNVEIFRS